MKRSAVLMAAAALLLAGCGDDDASQRPESEPMEASEPAEDGVEPYAPNVGDSALSVGETREGESFTMTLSEIVYPLPQEQYRDPAAGNVFVGLDLQQCLTQEEPDAYSSYNGEWTVLSVDNEEFTGSGSYWNDWPQPKFPESVTITTDRCLTGLMALEVPEDTVIQSVLYRVAGETLAEWLPPAGEDGAGGEPEQPAMGERRFERVEALKDAMIEEGYLCKNWRRTDVVSEAVASGSCSGADVFAIYETTADRDRQLQVQSDFNAEYGFKNDPQVIGPNWTANVDDPRSWAETVGGELWR